MPVPSRRGSHMASPTTAARAASDLATTAPLRIGSLCSGYGGLDLAVMDALGGDVAWHAQYDPTDRHQYAAPILAEHWPRVPNIRDITCADWGVAGPVDMVTARFPCP